MYAGRGLLDFLDAEPIPDDGNFTKWNGCLKHTKGAGVHSHKKVFFAMRGKTLYVMCVRIPSVIQWVVDPGYGWWKGQLITCLPQFLGTGHHLLRDMGGHDGK